MNRMRKVILDTKIEKESQYGIIFREYPVFHCLFCIITYICIKGLSYAYCLIVRRIREAAVAAVE